MATNSCGTLRTTTTDSAFQPSQRPQVTQTAFNLRYPRCINQMSGRRRPWLPCTGARRERQTNSLEENEASITGASLSNGTSLQGNTCLKGVHVQ